MSVWGKGEAGKKILAKFISIKQGRITRAHIHQRMMISHKIAQRRGNRVWGDKRDSLKVIAKRSGCEKMIQVGCGSEFRVFQKSCRGEAKL